MPYVTPTQIQCPVCRQPFVAQLEQIVDVGSDPAAKDRLLSGTLNVAVCPGCGRGGLLATPLLYHDPFREMLLVHVPMELNLSPTAREELVGRLTRTLMAKIPAEARKGYLFSPQTMLTMDSLVDRVLEADGIPREALEVQRKQSQLLARLLSALPEEVEALVRAHDDEIDGLFLQMVAAYIEAARRAGQENEAQKLTLLRNRVLALATWSRRRGLTPKALDEQEARLNVLEQFLAADESSWEELARQHDRQLDYAFFELVTALAEQDGPGELSGRVLRLRERLLDITSLGRDVKAGEQAIDRLKAAAEKEGGLTREMLLDQLLSTEGEAAVEALAAATVPLLDYQFFLAMADKIEAAEKAGDRPEAARLAQMRSRLVRLVGAWEEEAREQAERIQGQIAELLKAEDREAAIRRVLPELDQEFLSLLASHTDAARRAGQKEAASRLEELLNQVLDALKAGAPPEIRLVNDLIEINDEATLRRTLEARKAELTPAALQVMEAIRQDLSQRKQAALAARLGAIIEQAKGLAAQPG